MPFMSVVHFTPAVLIVSDPWLIAHVVIETAVEARLHLLLRKSEALSAQLSWAASISPHLVTAHMTSTASHFLSALSSLHVH